MGLSDRFIVLTTRYSAYVVVAFLVASLVVGSGVTALDQESGLEQFETDSEAADALEYVDANFGVDDEDDPDEDTTSAQVFVTGENVLDRDSLIATLELQQDFRDDERINVSLVEDPFDDIASVVATTAIREAEAEEIEERQAALEADQAALNETAGTLTDRLVETRELQAEYDQLNASYEAGEIDEETYEAESAAIEAELAAVDDAAADELTDDQLESFRGLVAETRAIQGEISEVEAAYAAGEIDEETRDAEIGALEEAFEGVLGAVYTDVLGEEFDELEARGEALQSDAADLRDPDRPAPTTDEQLDKLESMNDSEVEELVGDLLAEGGGGAGLYAFLPTDYEPGSTQADARFLVVTQTTAEPVGMEGEAPPDVVETQLAMADLVEQRFGDAGFVFGVGLISDEIDRSLGDSFALVLPLALLFVTLVLAVAYRDVLDIALGIAGIVLVLTWTFGFMGWAGLSFNQIMVAVPVLLVGLSIDYAIHLFMRHREHRAGGVRGDDGKRGDGGTRGDDGKRGDGGKRGDDGKRGDGGQRGDGGKRGDGGGPEPLADGGNRDEPTEDARTDGAAEGNGTRPAMKLVLVGLGIAFLSVTATAAIGFLANVISPVGPIREFGIASAFGIVSALLVFGVFVPSAKVWLDSVLEARGIDRRKPAFGTGGGRLSDVLAIGKRAGGRGPWVVVVVVLLLTAGGVYGASQVDTSFEQEDFLADDPPEWMKSLPEPFAPGDYSAKANLQFVNEHFLRQDLQAQVLVRGEVTDDRTLERLDEAEGTAAEQDAVVTFGDGSADVTSPLTVMDEVAAENESFNETYTAADTTGDGIPDENLTAVYDHLFEVAPDRAADVIHRTDAGEYESFRLIVSVRGDALAGDVSSQMDAVAEPLDGDGLSAIATGQIVVFHVIEQDLFQTVIDSLLITLVAVFAFLMLAYRYLHGSAVLGILTLLPIVFAVSWILGTMYLLDVPFNVMTGTITSLTIGLGVAYNIHMAERYVLERKRGYDLMDALHRSVTGTGGALLGSAATTIGGFGVLIFAILPPLQQFGLITGITIAYAFLGSVFVLPSLLVLWTRHVAGEAAFERAGAGAGGPDEPSGETAANGGVDEPETDPDAPAVDASGGGEERG